MILNKYKSDVKQPSATFHSFIEYMTEQLQLFDDKKSSTLTKKYFDGLFEEFIEKADRILYANRIIINKKPEVEALKQSYLERCAF